MSLSTAYELVFESKEGADVTFIIDKKELQAHQFVLITRSPVLKAMIKGPMAPSNQRHSIDDPKVTYEDFNNFLKFIYTDQCEINAANAEVLLHLSHMYDVPFLFETCVNKIPQMFHESDLYKFAEIGFLYENKCDMIVKCMKAVPCNVPTARLQYFKRNKMVTTVSWISTGLALEFVKHCPRTDTFSENMVFQKSAGRCDIKKC
uniref:BTB domain-containing protein n=1 Tax=Panagrolaimus superbus TaxID=310955 RepID=A0A914XY29_9BILA